MWGCNGRIRRDGRGRRRTSPPGSANARRREGRRREGGGEHKGQNMRKEEEIRNKVWDWYNENRRNAISLEVKIGVHAIRSASILSGSAIAAFLAFLANIVKQKVFCFDHNLSYYIFISYIASFFLASSALGVAYLSQLSFNKHLDIFELQREYPNIKHKN